MLARCILSHLRQGALACCRIDEGNRPATRDDRRQQSLRHHKRRAYIGAIKGIEFRHGCEGQGFATKYPRAVNQEIDAGEFLTDFRDKTLYGVIVCQVERPVPGCGSLRLKLFAYAAQFLWIARRQQHARAASREFVRQRLANATAGAGNYGDSVFEILHLLARRLTLEQTARRQYIRNTQSLPTSLAVV